MRTALRLAWREARSAKGKFLFVVVSVALGVGALTGVRGFSRSFAAMLNKEARTLMAADLTVRIFALPTPDQQAVLDDLARAGNERTQITETLSMTASSAVPDPLLVTIKAVDPRQYPFYGEFRLKSGARLRSRLGAGDTVVSEDILARLRVAEGETLRIGGQDFRVAGVIDYEPDRMTGSMNVGPRLLMSREGLARTELIRFGSRAAQRFLFRLPPGGANVAAVRERLKKTFPEALVIDFRETNPAIARGLDRSTTFLSLVTLIALIVGALGVAMAMHAHLQQRMDSIAILKCLGARSGQVIRIYALQTLLLGLAGGVLGILLGLAVEQIFPLLIARYFQLRPETVWDPMVAVQGLAAGVGVTLLFTLPPLIGIRRVKPALILRRDMEDARPAWRRHATGGRAGLAVFAAIAASISVLAVWLGGGWRTAVYFVAGVAGSFAALSFTAVLLLRMLRFGMSRSRRRFPSWFKQGIMNIYRPGSQAPAVLLALGIGVMFTFTVYLIEHGVLREMTRTAPPAMANVFLLDIAPQQRDLLNQLIRTQNGVERPPDIIPTVSARLTAVNGTPVEHLNLTGFARRYRMQRAITTISAKPEETEVLEGQWWSSGTPPGSLSLSEPAARALNVKPGMTLEWTSFGRPIRTTISSIHRTDQRRLSAMIDFVAAPGLLDGLPAVYYGAVRVKPAAVAALQRAIYERFPTVTVLNVADVLERVQEVVAQIALVIRFLSFFAILAGVTILASSIAGTRFRRMREAVILKTLGATRARVIGVFSVEFLVLGLVAGTMGSLLGAAFSALVLKRLLNAAVEIDLPAMLATTLLTAAIAVVTGWAASYRILGMKPLEILRSE